MSRPASPHPAAGGSTPPGGNHAPPAGSTATSAAAVPDLVAAMLRTPFNSVLSDPIRLRLQAALHGLPGDGSMTFTTLRKALQLSDGNLGAHLAMLVDAGYACATPTWHGKRRTTRYAATSAGRAAFEDHVRALEAVIEASHRLT